MTGERTSYLTAEEVAACQVLHKSAPYALCNVWQEFQWVTTIPSVTRFEAPICQWWKEGIGYGY